MDITDIVTDWYNNFGSFYTYIREGRWLTLNKFYDGVFNIGFEYV